MKENYSSYRSYLLRLWHESGAELAPWRIVLVNPRTGERQAFTEVEQLTMFLNEQIHEIESQQGKILQDQGGQNDQNERS